MAIEDGLLLLIQQGLAAQTPPVVATGAGVELPKDVLSPTAPLGYTVRSIVSEPTYFLSGQDGFTGLEVQIDCHGLGRDFGGPGFQGAVTLARAIDAILRGGYAGTLPDADGTVVEGIFRRPHFVDGFSDANRSYVRTMEYLINYHQV